jgi:hypothetical protein
MTTQIKIPVDDETFECTSAAAAARGMSVDACATDLVKRMLPPAAPATKGDVSSIFGLVEDGAPTDIAKEISRDKGRPIGEAAHKERDGATRC